MKLSNISLKKLGFFSLAFQTVSLAIAMCCFVFHSLSLFSFLCITVSIFYIFFFFIAVSRLVEAKSMNLKSRLGNWGYFILCLPITYLVFPAAYFLFSALFASNNVQPESVEIYRVKNENLTKADSIAVKDGVIVEEDTLAVITKVDTVRFNLKR